MADLDGGKGLDVQLVVELPQTADQFQIPLFFQSRMQPADHVNLGDPLLHRTAHGGDDLRNRHLKRVRVALARGERAELAGEDADVRVVDVAIENVGGDVAVLALAHEVRDRADRVQVFRRVEPQRVRIGNSSAVCDLRENVPKFRWYECRDHRVSVAEKSRLRTSHAGFENQAAFQATAR